MISYNITLDNIKLYKVSYYNGYYMNYTVIGDRRLHFSYYMHIIIF